jgi:6-phosphofructokinase 1
VRRERVDALVVIGGNGSQAGAAALASQGVRTVGIASTIDNDVAGFDITLGADTALGVALEAIDRLKVTAASHRRISVVEVMGRDCGYLALAAGVAGGAEAIVIPEMPTTLEDIVHKVRDAFARGQNHAVIVVAEGAALSTTAIVGYVEEHVENLGLSVRATILGHVQRGGTPGPFDRLLGSRLGFAAVHQLAQGIHGVVLGLAGGRVVARPFAEVVGKPRQLDKELVALELALTR